MKKKRGLKRYYSNLVHSLPVDQLDLENENVWFDLYHFHIDNTGLGNRSWKSRKQHLDALFSIAEKVEEKLTLLSKPFQYWVTIYEHNSFDDAIYIHTENPNGTSFPYVLSFDQHQKFSNKPLKTYLEAKSYDRSIKILLDDANQPILTYFLQKEGLGLPLRKV